VLLDHVAAIDGFLAFAYGELAADDDPDGAIEWFTRSMRLSDTLGTTYTREIARIGRAAILVRQRRTADAARACSESVRATARMGMWPQVWTTLRITAELLVAEGHATLAATVLTAADADEQSSEVLGPGRERLADLWATIRATRSPEEVAAARAAGLAATRAQVVEQVVTTLAALG
jgi:hypothetical protein